MPCLRSQPEFRGENESGAGLGGADGGLSFCTVYSQGHDHVNSAPAGPEWGHLFSLSFFFKLVSSEGLDKFLWELKAMETKA